MNRFFEGSKCRSVIGSYFRLNSSLVVVEHNHESCSSSLKNVLSAAKKLNQDVKCLVLGKCCKPVAEYVAKYPQVSKCVYVDLPELERRLPEYHCDIVCQYIRSDSKVSHVLAGSTSFGKSIIPRIASQFACAPLTDIMEVISQNTFVRSNYAGNVVTKVVSKDAVLFMTVLHTCFEPAILGDKSCDIENAKLKVKCKARPEWLGEELTKSDLPDLGSARIVVSGGRALKDKEGFQLIYQLAKKLRAGVGASRAAVDAGFVPNDLQVGQTGKIVAPELYVAIGISGAIQHLAGMKDSKIIVAINKDPEAPIFSVADYGLVEDLFKVLPEMISKIE